MNTEPEPRSRTRRVQAVGAYGMDNFGDELFVSSLRERSHLLWPQATVRTFAPRNGAIFSRPNIVGRAARTSAALTGLAWADLISLCGGSLLQDVNGVSRLRQRAGGIRRFEAIGVSIGPFASEDAAARVGEWLACFERVILRDSESIRRLQMISPRAAEKATLGGDLAALSSLIQPTAEKSDVITICPSAASETDAKFLAYQIREIAQLSRRRERIRLLALSYNATSNDEALCDRVLEELRSDNLPVTVDSFRNLGVEGTIDAISDSSMVLSQRLHGAIVAYLAETPFLVVKHHAKCADFAKDVKVHPDTLLAPSENWRGALLSLSRKDQQNLLPTQFYRDRATIAYSQTSAN